jgi:transcriptional regulator with XRE-family HTH domain
VDAAHLLRVARRAAGLSQRQLAERTGLSRTTLARCEAGRRGLPVDDVRRALAEAGLDLAVVPAPDHDEAAALRAHLRLSLVRRLHRALGGTGAPQLDRTPVWQALWRLPRLGHVQVVGAAAIGVWLPLRATTCAVVLHVRAGGPAGPLDVPDGLTVEVVTRPLPTGAVEVGLGPAVVRVLPPELLSCLVGSGEERAALLAAARLLDAEAPRDGAGRRAAAHRGVRPWWDQAGAEGQGGGAHRPAPPPDSRRGWQLDGPVSREQWLRRHG